MNFFVIKRHEGKSYFHVLNRKHVWTKQSTLPRWSERILSCFFLQIKWHKNVWYTSFTQIYKRGTCLLSCVTLSWVTYLKDRTQRSSWGTQKLNPKKSKIHVYTIGTFLTWTARGGTQALSQEINENSKRFHEIKRCTSSC